MKGEPANPHTNAELEAKFMQLGAPIWGDDVALELLAGVMRLEQVEDFGVFADPFNL